MHHKTTIWIVLQSLLLLCDICQGHGGYHEEIKHCNEQLATDPKNAGIWFQRGCLNYLHGDWEQSLADLDRAESLAPGKHPVELARGQALMAGGKFEPAKAAFDSFVKSDPNVAEAYSSRASLMMKLADPTAATADFKKAIELKTTPEPDDYLAWATAWKQAGKPEQSLQAIDAGLSKLGALPALANKAIDIELSLHHYDAALKRAAAQQALASRPEPWMARRASILAEAGRIEHSRAAWIELHEHLLALPAPERGSHAMSHLLEQSQIALDAIAANIPVTAP